MAKKHFAAKPQNGRFSVIPSGTRSVVIVGHFFGGPAVPPSFVDKSCISQTKNLLLAPNIKILGTKLHIFVLSDPLAGQYFQHKRGVL